jgi:Tol biopolymer transport system component/tRNA A-37 threonylcarbamoyl transferase component Bud32
LPNVLTRLQAALADRYRLERELGQGGMATVYLAQDLRHDRKVAVKVLRPELAAIIGAERFLAEIKTTASLQHPHILALHDSGETDGFLFYVMPFIEGESLRDRLSRERQLPVDEAVRIATEAAGALQYAHRHGVIHRDIKPENILLHDGSALVADFGIALAVSSAGGGRMTETGMSLGTPHYMSPEQAMGEREITARSDVYALGAVLYEMLSGDPPFTGSTAQAIVARVLTESPRPLLPQRHTVPPYVEAAVLRALEKLPADRFASAAQFAGALTYPGSVPMAPAATGAAVALGAAHRGRRVARLAVAAGALMLAALLSVALWTWLGPRPESPVRQLVRFDIQLPRDAQPVGAPGSTIAFSPDGSQIVYIGKAPSGQRLYVRRMDRPDPIPVPGSEGGTLPFFSPDGQWLGFKQGGKLVKVALAGGPVTPICTVAGIPYGATWTAGDTIIFAADSGIMDVPAAGGSPHLIARPDSGEVFHFPDVLPGGRAVLFGVAGGGTLKLAALIRRTGEVKRLQQPGGYPRYVTGGFVVLSDPSGILSAVPFDATRLEVTGPARPIVDQLGAGADGDVNLGVSRSGDFAFQASTSEGSRLVLLDRGGVARDAGGADTSYYQNPRLAPDGRRVALLRATEFSFSSRDVWVFDLVQHTRTRVTFDTTAGWPLWTPDGRRIAYTHFPDGSRGLNGHIYWVPADGSGAPESLVVRPGQWWASSFEPDGRGFIYSGFTSPQAKEEIWQVRLEGGTAPRRVLATGFNNAAPSLSPDGRWLAYVADESGRDEVYVRPYPGPGGRWQVSLDGGTEPLWSPTGHEIFYRNGDLMIAAAVRTRAGFEVRGRTRLFTGSYDPAVFKGRNYDVTRDGRTFLMLQRVVGARQAVVVTLNWFDEANRKVRGNGD